jgi:hypothetical protein
VKGGSVAEGPDAPSTDIAEALAYVCGRLDYLRAVLPPDEAGEPPALRALLEAVSHAHDLTGPLDALHIGLLNAGDALGVWGHVRSGVRSLNVPGVDEHTPFEVIYLCPLGRCAGRRPDRTTTFPVTCAIAGRELRRERL